MNINGWDLILSEKDMAHNIWLISDTHFGHANIIKYCDRPFSSLKEMDDTLVDNWNSCIKEQDKVYHLGDVYFGNKKDDNYWDWFFSRLNGKKRLILGNHDSGKNKMLLKHFQKIYVSRAFRDWGMVLTHIPVHPSSRNFKKGLLVNVHGHIHQKESPKGPYFNVCVEKMEYKPIHIENVKQLIKNKK